MDLVLWIWPECRQGEEGSPLLCVTSFVDGPSLVWSAESEVGEAEVDRRRREDQRRPVEEHRRHLKMNIAS